MFMQYNRLAKSSFGRLPNLVVDTGMGLERLTAVLNGLESNYESDLFMPLFNRIHEHCGHMEVAPFREGQPNAYRLEVVFADLLILFKIDEWSN